MISDLTMEERLRIGSLLRRIRQECGISQKRLSELSGIDRSTISLAEHGKHSISVDSLVKLAKAVNSSVEIVKNDE